jgi:hypothetical protein
MSSYGDTTYAITSINLAYEIVSAGSPLPVGIIQFNGYRSGAAIALHWTASDETNMDRYEIQRSADGTRFDTIGSVFAKNNGTNDTKYSWLDDSPLHGKNSYRLRMVDRDGIDSHSKIIEITYDVNSSVVQILPNPTQGPLTILGLPNGGEKLLQLSDMSGRTLSVFKTNNSMITIDISNQPAGMYLLKITSAGEANTYKIFRL